MFVLQLYKAIQRLGKDVGYSGPASQWLAECEAGVTMNG